MAILKPCEIDFGNPPAKSEMLVSINDVPLGTQGNLFGITGGEGTGKSNFVGSLVAGTIGQKENVDTLGTNVQRNSAGKAFLLYDTEQSEVLYKNIRYITTRENRKYARLFQSLLFDRHVAKRANAGNCSKYG